MRDTWMRLSLLLLLLILPLGCSGGSGDAPKRFPVSGAVTLDDKPVVEGDIIFKPADGNGQADGGKIVDGTYSLETTPGKKRVEINASREIPGKMVESGIEAGKQEPAREDYIPAEYNTQSTLSAEVKAEGDNKFDFPLKSK